jgi:tetratricopeptide (TPR) repeat protein
MTESAGGAELAAAFRARQLLELGRPAEALGLLYSWLSSNPDDVEALCLAARAELALGRHGTARDLAAGAIALDPTGDWPLRILALALSGLGQDSAAVDAAQQAVALSPNSFRVHVALATVAMRRKRFRNVARASAQRAVQLGPNEADCYLVLGQVELAFGPPAKAEEALRTALRLEPGNASALNELGRVAVAGNNYQKGAEHFSQSARSDPADRAASRNLVGLVRLTLLVVQLFVVLIVVGVSPLVFGARQVPALLRLPVTWALIGLAFLFIKLILARALRRALWPVLRADRRSARAVWLMLATLVLLVVVDAAPSGRLREALWLICAVAISASVGLSLLRRGRA